MKLITETLHEQPSLLYCVDEDKARKVIRTEAIIKVTEKLMAEENGKIKYVHLKNIKGGNKKMAWVKYNEEMKQKCLDLIKQGKTITEVVEIIQGPKKKALIRWAKKANVSFKQ